ncbi:hypothetical protein C2G38_2092608, partial [Gigaspora rosea]
NLRKINLNELLIIRQNNTFALRIRGTIYRMMSRYEESLVDLNKSLEIEPNNAFALRIRGDTYRMMSRYEESLVDLNKSLEIEPNNAEALRICEESLVHLNKSLEIEPYNVLICEELITDLNKLLIIRQNNAFALRIRGATYRIINRFEESLADFNKSLAIEPSAEALRIREELLVILNKSLEIEPYNLFSLRIRGDTYRMMSIYEDSLADLNKLLEIEPNNAEALRIREDTYLMMNRYEELLADLNKLLEIDSNNAETLRNRGATYRIMGRYEESLASLSKKLKESASKGDVYGVMPYIAPEILLGEQYTKASDIYSMGVIMAELSTGKRPFYDYTFDFRLASNICNGLRPGFSERTPRCFIELAKQCMDSNPCNRPTAKDISSNLSKWRTIITNLQCQYLTKNMILKGVLFLQMTRSHKLPCRITKVQSILVS